MLVYQKHMSIMFSNPTAELVRVKVDLLGYVNITNEIPVHSTNWGAVKLELIPPKPGTIWDKTALTRQTKYTNEPKPWTVSMREVLDNDDLTDILKSGGLIHGMAGTGKSTILRALKQHIENDYLIGSFTHKASRVVNGSTLHRLLGIDGTTQKTHIIN